MKAFLIIGNQNAITYKEIFPLIKGNRVWLGINNGAKEYLKPDGTRQKMGNTGWFTNLVHNHRHEPLILTSYYTPDAYPKYDNYDAINVDKTNDIPCDYDGVMGVPISPQTINQTRYEQHLPTAPLPARSQRIPATVSR